MLITMKASDHCSPHAFPSLRLQRRQFWVPPSSIRVEWYPSADDSPFSPTSSFVRSIPWGLLQARPAASTTARLSSQTNNGPTCRNSFHPALDRELPLNLL